MIMNYMYSRRIDLHVWRMWEKEPDEGDGEGDGEADDGATG